VAQPLYIQLANINTVESLKRQPESLGCGCTIV
jgi:hypothetical protein